MIVTVCSSGVGLWVLPAVTTMGLFLPDFNDSWLVCYFFTDLLAQKHVLTKIVSVF